MVGLTLFSVKLVLLSQLQHLKTNVPNYTVLGGSHYMTVQ